MIYPLCLTRQLKRLTVLLPLLVFLLLPQDGFSQQDLTSAEFSYSPIGKRDPFKSLLDKERETKKRVSQVKLTPIQKFDLGQFRLQAVLIGKGKPKAMVSAPDGKTYIVSPGIKIGKRSGVITNINKDGIHVVEIDYDNFTGAEKKENALIRMPEPKAF